MTTEDGRTLTIAIIGGGFGGTYLLKEIEQLRNRFPAPVEALLFEPRSSFIFTPLLHELATAGLDEEHVLIPFSRIFDGKPWIRHIAEPVVSVDLKRKTVATAEGEYRYDYVLLATGSATNFFDNKEVERHCFTLKDEKDARRIRDALEHALHDAAAERDVEKQRLLLSVVVVGGGPSGVELAPEILQFLSHRIKTEHLAIKQGIPSLALLQGASTIIPIADPRLQATAKQSLERHGVRVITSARVETVTKTNVTYCKDGALVTAPAAITIWVAGIAPRIVPGVQGAWYSIAPDLSLAGHPDAFAIGDAARFDPASGLTPLPARAQVAVRQATHAAKNLLARSRDEATSSFLYRERGFLVSLGQHDAAGEIATPFGKLYVRGFLVWWLWRTIYLFNFLDANHRRTSAVEWTRRLFIRRSPAPPRTGEKKV